MLRASGWILSLWVVSVHGVVTRPPVITKEPDKDVYYKPGETVMLPCEGNGQPMPVFSWTRNGLEFNPSGNDARAVQLQNSGTLVFNTPEEKDEGMFQCSAVSGEAIAVSVLINMRVAKMEMFVTRPDEIHYVSLGMPFTLPCVPPESVPPAQVIWIVKDDLGGIEAVSYDARVTMDREFGLNFANIMEEDERGGQPYSCMALSNIMRLNAKGPRHYIEVQGQTVGYQDVKYMWADQDDRFGLRGSPFSIKCIFSGFPTPVVHWDRTDNKTFSSRVKFTMFSTEMTIENLQYDDAGSYECWADNIASGGKRETRVFNVRVSSRPQFLQKPDNVETSVGATVQFHCRADGNPPPTILWYINGVLLSVSTDKTKQSNRFKTIAGNTIQIENVTTSDNKVFQCNATNIHGYAFANAYLNVLAEAPDIFSSPKSYMVSAEGVSVNLTCRVTGKPDPIITWIKNGVQVTGGRYQILSNGDLHISSVVLADAADYRCEAQNMYGSDMANGTLVVRRKTRIEQKPGDLERNAGMDAKFTCSGTTDPEEVQNLRIIWLKDGKAITSNDQRMMTNFQDNSLTISGTITRDSGTYTCVATNGLDEARASAVLTVKDRPDPPLKVVHQDCSKHVIISWMPGSYNNAPVQYFVLQYNTSFAPDRWTFEKRVNSTISKVNITLSPYVNYTFRVLAINKIGRSDPSLPTPNFCTTKEDRPFYHPKNLRTIGNQPNTLYIEWTPIPPIQHNAPGFRYQLEILREGDAENDKDIITINDWRENYYEMNTGRVYEAYKIVIKARNNVGDAREDPPSITGYSAESIPSIQPTNFEYVTADDTSTVFRWNFDRSQIGITGTRIKGEFRGFKIQFWQQNKQALTIREADIGPDVLLNTTGNTFSSRVQNMLPNTPMEARISVMNNFYVGRPTEAIRFHTEPGFPGPVEHLRILNIGDTHVNLEWGLPLENRGDLEGYDISYQLVNGLDLGEMQEREPQINDQMTTNTYLSGLQPRKKYRVHIFARTKKGRGEGYFIEFVTAKPGFPRMPRFRVMDVGKHFINISWWVNAYSSSGSVIFVEYRKLDGAEWLRTTDEVVNTWKKIDYLEAGTTYEIRIKSTNGARSVASSIAEVETDGIADAYDIAGNFGWFIGMILALLLVITLMVLFYLCYRRGFNFYSPNSPDYANNTSAAYSDTARMDQGSDRFGAEPKGYNNDYYDDKDYHNYDYDEKRPPSYSSDHSYKAPPPGEYEDYNRRPSRDYDDKYDTKEPSKFTESGAPVDDRHYYDDRRDDGYYDRRNDDYYDRRDDYYDHRDDYYDRRNDDYYGQQGRDDYYDRRDDGYGYDDRRDDGYDQDQYQGRGNGKKGYDYDSDEPPRRGSSSQAGNGHSSTVV